MRGFIVWAVVCLSWLPACGFLGIGGGDDDGTSIGDGLTGQDDDSADDSADDGAFRSSSINPPVTNSNNPNPPPMSYWGCTELSTSCECKVQTYMGLQATCTEDWKCCLSSTDKCECTDSATCDAEVASRPGTTRVAACPPGAENTPKACAAENENCTAKYLADEKKPGGCCDGLVCKTVEGDVRACQPGTAEEQRLAAMCEDSVALTDSLLGNTALAIETQLSSSQGEVPFDTATVTLPHTGAGGCLAALTIKLAQQADPECSLSFNLTGAGDGTGTLHAKDGSFSRPPSCAGFPPGLGQRSTLAGVTGTLRFDGFACENAPRELSGVSGAWCFAGTFELSVTGAIAELASPGPDPDAGSPPPFMFDPTPMRLSGRVCSPLGGVAPCP